MITLHRVQLFNTTCEIYNPATWHFTIGRMQKATSNVHGTMPFGLKLHKLLLKSIILFGMQKKQGLDDHFRGGGFLSE